MSRVVSLLASGTEIVCAIGAGEMLVGRSHECDRPIWVKRLPMCTRPAFDTSGTSGAIDAEVKRRCASGEPLYQIDAELLDALGPDVLIAQVHCDVCAVTPDDARKAGNNASREIVALQAGSVQGIYDDVRAIGRALGREERATAVVAALQAQIAALGALVHRDVRPRVLVLEWTDPLFVAGNWMPELIEAAGGICAMPTGSPYSVRVDWRDVQAADPDVVIVAPCGFDLERTLREVRYLEALPGWDRLRAVREGNVAFADGNAYFNRSGTTIGDTAEILAEIGSARPGIHHRRAWLSYAESRTAVTIGERHEAASANGSATYTDPTTGYEVMTADFLRRRGPCCGSGCRHCPYAAPGESEREGDESKTLSRFS